MRIEIVASRKDRLVETRLQRIDETACIAPFWRLRNPLLAGIEIDHVGGSFVEDIGLPLDNFVKKRAFDVRSIDASSPYRPAVHDKTYLLARFAGLAVGSSEATFAILEGIVGMGFVADNLTVDIEVAIRLRPVFQRPFDFYGGCLVVEIFRKDCELLLEKAAVRNWRDMLVSHTEPSAPSDHALHGVQTEEEPRRMDFIRHGLEAFHAVWICALVWLVSR